jgi:hypothetical protein
MKSTRSPLANATALRRETSEGGVARRTATYLPTHRSAQTDSPVLSSLSWKRGTHFLKHASVILRAASAARGSRMARQTSIATHARGAHPGRTDRRCLHVLVEHVGVEGNFVAHQVRLRWLHAAHRDGYRSEYLCGCSPACADLGAREAQCSRPTSTAPPARLE